MITYEKGDGIIYRYYAELPISFLGIPNFMKRISSIIYIRCNITLKNNGIPKQLSSNFHGK